MKLPRPLARFWEGWKRVSHAVGLVLSTVLLALFWLVVIGGYAVVLQTVRLCGKRRAPASYWRDLAAESDENLQHPF